MPGVLASLEPIGCLARRQTPRWYFTFFVISGFCSLLYEVVWLRLAMASFGVTTAMASIVLSMFMAGLGLGSWATGRLMRRRPAPANALRKYAVAELLVGLSAILVPRELTAGRVLLQHVSSVAAWQSSAYYALAAAWVAFTLVPWCTAMGATFPLLLAAMRGAASRERAFSYLYLANVLGALIGTLASSFVLIERLGFRGALYVACALNAAVAFSALRLSVSAPGEQSTEPPMAARPAYASLYGLSRRGILLLLLTTGLVSMGLEVIWIREFTPYLGNVVYAFAAILAIYLLATCAGSYSYRRWARAHDAGESAPAWTILALSALVPILTADPFLALGATGILDVLRIGGIAMFCACAGFLTPLLVDSFSSGDPDRAGTAYGVNVVGSLLGPLLAGFGLLPWLSERWAAAALCALLFGIGALVVWTNPATSADRSARRQKRTFAIATCAAIVLVGMTHDFERRYDQGLVRRDYAATVIATGRGFDRRLLVNGIGMTALTPITKYMTHLPLAMMDRPPRDGLVICFGMGTSFRSMLSWHVPSTTVELVPSVPEVFGFFHPDAAAVRAVPGARIVIDDGRRFLDGADVSYDVIVADPPPPPEATGSSLLYSREFNAVIARHLRRDGILQTWFPSNIGDDATLASIAKALRQSFRFVRAFESFDRAGVHFLARNEPWPAISSELLASRLPPDAARDLVEWGPRSTPRAQFDEVLSREMSIDAIVAKDPDVPALEDDRPINEYFLLRRLSRWPSTH